MLRALSSCLLLALLACNQSGPAPSNPNPPADRDGGVKVKAPGVNVDVQPKDTDNGKVRVKAPGVNVEVEKNR